MLKGALFGQRVAVGQLFLAESFYSFSFLVGHEMKISFVLIIVQDFI